MELQFALMVSSSHEPSSSKVILPSCSKACIDYVKTLQDKIETLGNEVENLRILRELNDKLIRDIEDLRYEGYRLRKGQKPLKAQLE